MVRVHPDPPTRRSPPGSIPGSRRISCRFAVSTAGRRCKRGAVAQLGEHLLCKQGVTGSIPVSSTSSYLISPCSIVIPPMHTGLYYVCIGGLTVAVQSPSCSLKIRESCWRLGFASGLAAGCISNVCQSFAENQSANESCCAYGLRLFEVIWSSEQAHTVDA